jgi:translation initiation factor 1A
MKPFKNHHPTPSKVEVEEKDFGDFEEVVSDSEVENKENSENNQEEGFVRARFPKKGEFIGKIMQRYGGNRMEVITTDGKTRNCRVPGKYKRQLWLRPKDIILIKIWEFDTEKGDIIYKYRPNEVTQLKKKGILENLDTEF